MVLPAPIERTTPRIVLLGMGGLGCPAALALVEEAREADLALTLVLIDDDRVEPSNLARQILYRAQDVGRPKVEAAVESLRSLVPGAPVELLPIRARFDRDNAPSLLAGATALLDGSDNFATRFLANDLARAAGVPLVHGAAVGWTGNLLTVVPGRGGCLRCIFEAPPPPGTVPACAEAGVASPLCGLVGAAMAGEALWLAGGRDAIPLAASRLIRWNALSGSTRASEIRRDPACPACAAQPAPASAPSAPARSRRCPSQ